MRWGTFFGTAFRGLSLAAVLLVAALGLAITFGLMGVINMAHGEIIMVGAYSAYVTQNVFTQMVRRQRRRIRLLLHRRARSFRSSRRHALGSSSNAGSSAFSTNARSNHCSPPGA